MAVNQDTVKQFEALVRMIEAKKVRQAAALAQTELQLRAAVESLERAKKGV